MICKPNWKHPALLSIVIVLATLAACAPAAAPPTPAPPPPAKAAAPAAPKPTVPPTPVVLEKIDIVNPALSPNQAIIEVTKQAGLFKKNGLDANIPYVEGGTLATQGLVGGTFKMAMLAGPDVVNSNFAGADTVVIASAIDKFMDVLVVGKGINKPEDLKGKKIGISQFGTLSDLATRIALKELKLEPDKEVAIVQIGGEQSRIAALKAGGINAGLVDTSLIPVMESLGLKVIYSFLDSKARFQGSALVTTRAYIKQNPETVRKVMRSLVEGIAFYKANKSQTVDIIAKWMKTDDKENVAKAYDVRLKVIPEKPYPSLEGLQTVLDFASAKEPRAKTAKPEQFADSSFVKELDQSGFIDSLYKPK